ncbi:hypothetical protein K435DRAFT_694544, partial [Dendrothele bispora CBS 962.96]
APSEAEAQCAELARGGNGSEDMDTLTFNAPILFRHLTFSEAKKQPISEINLQAALKGLDKDMSQDVGPKSALKLIREHGSLDKVVEHLRAKYVFLRCLLSSLDSLFHPRSAPNLPLQRCRKSRCTKKPPPNQHRKMKRTNQKKTSQLQHPICRVSWQL